MKNNGGWDTWERIQIQINECRDKLHAERIKRELVKQLKAALNKYINSCDR